MVSCIIKERQLIEWTERSVLIYNCSQSLVSKQKVKIFGIGFVFSVSGMNEALESRGMQVCEEAMRALNNLITAVKALCPN